VNIRFPFWQEVKKLLVNRHDGTYAERVEAYPPKVLMTDDDGDYARMRVDVGQTGFFAGREFRTFYDFTLNDGATFVLKAVSPINVILYDFTVDLELGDIEVELLGGGTQGGTFSIILPIRKTNNMTDASDYANKVVMTGSGTHTGGTTFDKFRVFVGDNLEKVGGTKTASEAYPIGFAPGTYYIKLKNLVSNKPAKGIFRARWEERP
jgi:hypothetical protein